MLPATGITRMAGRMLATTEPAKLSTEPVRS
jgi:hypothetical protein